MAGNRLTEEQRRQAADQAIAGKKADEIASELGVTARAVRNWAKARRAELAGGNGRTTPPEEKPAERKPWSSEGHREALRAMGEPVDDGEERDPERLTFDDPERIPPDEAEEHISREEAEREALEFFADLKAELVETIVDMKFAPPLSPQDPRVQRAARPGPFLRRCIRKNLDTFGPAVDLVAESPWTLLGAVVLDGIFTMRRLKKAAEYSGWKPPDEPPPGEPVKPRDAGAAAPPPAAEPEAPAPGRPRVLDAPAALPQAGS